LNSADKSADWTHTAVTPLDPRYGAGAVDLSNAIQELQGGIDPVAISTQVSLGTHPSVPAHGLATSSLTGWDFNTIASTSKSNGVNHYEFDVKGSSSFTLTATLVWERHLNQSGINNLDLHLYNTDTHTLTSQSISAADNVEQLFTKNLAPGHYDLEVVKNGGKAGVTPGDVSDQETYALAFNFAKAATASGTTSSSFLIAAAIGAVPSHATGFEPAGGAMPLTLDPGAAVFVSSANASSTAATSAAPVFSTVPVVSSTLGVERSGDAFAGGGLSDSLLRAILA
jgi:hypothetical protein